MRAARSALAATEVRAASEACCAHAQSLVRGVVALYSAFDNEIDPAQLHISDAVWPHIEGDGRMSFRSGPLQPGKYGIPSPAADAAEKLPDTIVVPGVAFDRRGQRLGYGRGYYDRALQARPEALRIGFCHSFQLVEKLDERPHDEPVDFIVTPDGAQATHARASKETL